MARPTIKRKVAAKPVAPSKSNTKKLRNGVVTFGKNVTLGKNAS